MENTNEVKKKSKSKLIIIILLIIIVIAVVVAAFFIISDKSSKDVKSMFESKEEYTILLDEFITNLKTDDKGKKFLKVQVALMYKDKKNTEIINTNVSKIRDIIVNDLREKTAEEVLAVEKTGELKNNIIEKVNASLDKKIVEEVYFTNLIVQ